MKKKVLAALFVFVLIQFLLPVVSAAEPSSGNPTANGVSVTVNGNAVQWPDAVPFIDEHGRTMVPLRAVADAIGLDVSWNANTKEASFANGGKTIIFPIGSNTARTSNGAFVTMNTAAIAVNGRTYAPIRYLAEYFGYKVDWDANSRTVVISEAETPTQQPEIPSVTPTPGTDNQVMSAECAELLEIINSKRTAAGLKALTVNNNLVQGAKLRADDISKGYAETRGDGSNWDSVVKGLPDTATDLHETMAGGSDTASGIFDIMQTPDSIASMLNETYTQIGIGHVYNANGYGGCTATYGEFLDRNRDTHSVMVEEIVAPDGYTIDKPNMQQQEIVKGQKLQQFIFTDTGYPRIIISKVKRGTLDDLKGAVFQIDFDGTQFGTITTDRTGRIVIDYDTYRRFLNDSNETHSVKVTELKAPDGYLVDEPNWQELLIRRGQKEVNFTFSDTMYPSIIIIKRDRETQALLPNTEFTVAIDGVQIGNYKTDENGQIKIDYETYKHYLNEENHGNWAVSVTETKVPDKYNLDNQPESVGGSGTTVTQTLRYGQSLLPFEFEDTHFRDLRVRKVDAQTNYPLEGATFTLHCVEAANQKSGSVADRVGTTDGDGYFTFKDLPNRTYELYESSAPMGYSEDGVWADDGKTGKKTVVITSDSDRTLEFEFKNEPQTGFLIRKIDSVTKQPIPNVRFKITPLAPLTSPSWEAVTDDNGVIVRESLPEGSYRIEEISTVQGYVLNTEPQILQVKNQHDAYTVTFENNQTNMLNILKLDSETGQPLSGAQFSIDMANGTHVATVTTGIYAICTFHSQ